MVILGEAVKSGDFVVERRELWICGIARLSIPVFRRLFHNITQLFDCLFQVAVEMETIDLRSDAAEVRENLSSKNEGGARRWQALHEASQMDE